MIKEQKTKKLSKEELIKAFKEGKVESSSAMKRMTKKRIYDIMPEDFLSLAEKELKEKIPEDESVINSLSNIKRAIDSQIGLIIYEFGYKKKASTERWDFPDKIDFLKDKGIIAGKILEKINSTRNLLEHEFKKPERDKVEDAWDIAALFLAYSSKFRSLADFQGIIYNKKRYILSLNREDSKFEIGSEKGDNSLDIKEIIIEIGCNEDGFEEVHRLYRKAFFL